MKDQINNFNDVLKHHTLYNKMTIDIKVDKGISFIKNTFWEKQALGEFTASITKENWITPKGAF